MITQTFAMCISYKKNMEQILTSHQYTMINVKGEYYVIPVVTGKEYQNNVICLHGEVAKYIFTYIYNKKEATNYMDIAQKVIQTFDVSLEKALVDIKHFVNELSERGVITIDRKQ